MYFNGNITFKGTTSGSLGVIVSSMPKMQHSTVKATEYDIPLRDGIQYSSWRNRTDAQITVKFAIVKDNNTNYIQTLRATRQWLEGTGELILDNNPDVYYNVKKVEITNEEMFTLSSGELEATFVIEPFEYLRASTILQQVINKNTSGTRVFRDVSNAGDVCKPFIEFKKGSSDTISFEITVDNEKQINFTLNDASTTVYCDSNLMFTYNSQGNKEPLFLTHNYDDLWLPNGVHEIDVFHNSANASEDGEITIDLREGYAI